MVKQCEIASIASHANFIGKKNYAYLLRAPISSGSDPIMLLSKKLNYRRKIEREGRQVNGCPHNPPANQKQSPRIYLLYLCQTLKSANRRRDGRKTTAPGKKEALQTRHITGRNIKVSQVVTLIQV